MFNMKIVVNMNTNFNGLAFEITNPRSSEKVAEEFPTVGELQNDPSGGAGRSSCPSRRAAGRAGS